MNADVDEAEREGRRDMVRLIRNIFLIFAVVIGIGLLLIKCAFAHDSFISRQRMTDPASGEWCCSHIDCAEVPENGVKENGVGYVVLETNETIPYSRIIWKSEDGKWWRCRNMRTNATRCLIGPPPGS